MKQETALEPLFFIDLTLITMAICGTGLLFLTHHTAAAIVLAIITLCFLITDVLLSPWCYRFDAEGATVCYLFFREYLAWNDIEQISIEHSSDFPGGFLSALWLLPCFKYYALQGKQQPKRFFKKRRNDSQASSHNSLDSEILPRGRNISQKPESDAVAFGPV